MSNWIAFKILIFCIFILLVLICIITVLLVQERNNNYKLANIVRPFEKLQRDNTKTNNIFFTGKLEPIDFFAISLPKRKQTHFKVLKQDLQQENITLNYVQGINGKHININDYPLTTRYRTFFENNKYEFENHQTTKNYIGHLGCTLSHLKVIDNIENMSVILEDDADITPNFKHRLQETLGYTNNVDPEWEVIMLGFCANYNDHSYHKLNDKEPIYEGGIVRLHYWIGGWAYIVKNKLVAQKIINLFTPIPWHIDLGLAENARIGKLKVYGVVPTLINHPGKLRISSWDIYQFGNPSKLKTDTNI
jgi:GR25 family glycosyltransferase involved in LPS biosynthesis